MPITTCEDETAIILLARQAFDILSVLKSPIHCGHAFAIAQAMMMIEAGLTTEDQVTVVMETMKNKVIKHFDEMRQAEALNGPNLALRHS